MPLFRYKAITAEGRTQEGEMDAASQYLVIERLQSQGLIPVRADEISAGSSKSRGGRQSESSWFAPKKLSQDHIAVMTEELATLLNAKLPLDRALEILIELSPNTLVRTLVVNIREQVHGGATLSKAMEEQKGVFSRLYLNMVRAGEAGGALEVVLTRLTEYMERARELRETVSSALIYPTVLLGVAGLSVMILLIFVVPQFEQLFEDAGKALPLATQVVVFMGEILRSYWWALLLFGFAIYKYFQNQFANPKTRYRWDALFLRTPLVGDLVKKLEVARFSRTLGTLLGNGVPLLNGLTIVKETLNNQLLAESMGAVAESLKQGHGLSQPLLENIHFPRMAVHMIRVGEETGHLSMTKRYAPPSNVCWRCWSRHSF
jgi:general secretion pathway protein F